MRAEDRLREPRASGWPCARIPGLVFSSSVFDRCAACSHSSEMNSFGLILGSVAALLLVAHSTGVEGKFGGKILMCYIAQWSVYRLGAGKFSMKDIDPHLCTHLIYAYAGLNGTSYKITSRDPDGESKREHKGLIEEVVDLKKINPSLKVLASIGGWMEGSVNYSNMASTQERRGIFINSVLDYLSDNALDGLDLAWTYPGDRGGATTDKQNLVLLLKEMRRVFERSGYLLTIQVDGKRLQINVGYDLPEISKYVHYMNLLTYQYKQPWDLKTGPNAPLSSSDILNVEYSVDYMIRRGAKPEKMLLGLPAYGHPFILTRDVTDGKYMSVPTSEDIIPGFWSTENGFIGYNEVCEDLTNTVGWTEYWDSESSTPFAVKGRRFYSYDNVKSFKAKLDYLSWKGLGGAMVWSMDTDDFSGRCSGDKYPLIKSVKEYFIKNKNKTEQTSVDPVPTTSTTNKTSVIGEPVVVSHSHNID